MKALRFILVLTALLSFFNLQGQFNNFQTWSIEKGIPQSNVYAINQSNNGYLWVGTGGGGIAKFDGKTFTTYNTKQGLSGNTVRAILKDKEGSLWVGTENGVTYYNGYSFKTFTLEDSLKGNSVLSLLQDNQGRIWIGTDDAGINILERKNGKYEVIKNINEGYLPNSTVFSLEQAKDGQVWAGTLSGGINIINFKKDSIEIRYLREGIEIPSERILCSSKDREGNIWFGTYGNGVFKVITNKSGENLEIIRFPNFQKLNNSTVWDILCRKNGEVWLGTTEYGVIRMFPNPSADSIKLSYFTEAEGLPNNQILSLFEDKESNVWIGTNGDGLCKFGGDRFSHFTEENGLASKQVFSIDQNKEGDYWLGTDGGGLVKMKINNNKPVFSELNETNGAPSNYISSISLGNTNNNNLWVATTNKGIAKYDENSFVSYNEDNGLQDNRTQSILVDNRGIVWIGCADGISRYDGSVFINRPISDLKIEKEGIFCIVQDADSNIWFGTAGALAKYDGNGSITTYDEVEGLTNTYVNSLTIDKSDNIWIGTKGSGVFMLNTKSTDSLPIVKIADAPLLSSGIINSLVFENENILIAGTDNGFDRIFINDNGLVESVRKYSNSDGFIGVECNENAILKDKDGNIWFGTVKGLTRYNPHAEQINIIPPQVSITDVKLFFKEVNWQEKTDSITAWNNLPINLELQHNQNHLTFHFTGISLQNPFKVQYKFMLKGVDKSWSPLTTEGKMTYSGLPSGDYTFKVTAQNADGTWQSTPATFRFSILPPWYKTTWFYILCILTAILLFYGFVRFRERKLKEEKLVLENKVAERTEEVVQQKEEIEEKNKEIVDSINYAKTLQNAILPQHDVIAKALPEHFVYFRPKDIVSGDFYWFHETKEEIMFAVIDCTGHGVPGAFVSMVGNNLLNQIVIEKETTEPGKVLKMLNRSVKSIFLKEGALATANDGMDISFCKVSKVKGTLSFSGAMNGLVIINGEEIKELSADRRSIGGSTESDFEFKTETILIKKGDCIYLSSDGFPDQFGGEKGKKYKSANFRDFLLSISKKEMQQQHQLLENEFERWKGDLAQIDDVCIMGVRLTPYSPL